MLTDTRLHIPQRPGVATISLLEESRRHALCHAGHVKVTQAGKAGTHSATWLFLMGSWGRHRARTEKKAPQAARLAGLCGDAPADLPTAALCAADPSSARMAPPLKRGLCEADDASKVSRALMFRDTSPSLSSMKLHITDNQDSSNDKAPDRSRTWSTLFLPGTDRIA